MPNNINWDDVPHALGQQGSFDTDLIEEQRFDRAIAELKLGIRKAPKITKDEYEVLQFCHNRNMRQFLKEEFEKHPIILNENGELVGENPFEKERRELREMKISSPIAYEEPRNGKTEDNVRPPMTYEQYAAYDSGQE